MFFSKPRKLTFPGRQSKMRKFPVRQTCALSIYFPAKPLKTVVSDQFSVISGA